MNKSKKDCNRNKMPIIGGTYKHRTGNEYFVHFISRHDETSEVIVVYEELFDNHQIKHCPVEKFNKVDFALIKKPHKIPMD